MVNLTGLKRELEALLKRRGLEMMQDDGQFLARSWPNPDASEYWTIKVRELSQHEKYWPQAKEKAEGFSKIEKPTPVQEPADDPGVNWDRGML